MAYQRIGELVTFLGVLLGTTAAAAQPVSTPATPVPQPSDPADPNKSAPQGTNPSASTPSPSQPAAATAPAPAGQPSNVQPAGASTPTQTPTPSGAQTSPAPGVTGAAPAAAGERSPAPASVPQTGTGQTTGQPGGTTSVNLDPSYDTQPATEPPLPTGRYDPGKDAYQQDEAARAYYAHAYRPPENPARLYVGVRASHMIAGAQEAALAGRAAVIRAEIGHTWNYVGYAVGATAIAGRLAVGQSNDKNIYSLIGGGPSVSMGRLSLMRRGFFDVRFAYDFLYGKTHDGPEDSVTEVTTPHGPRLDLDLGLLMYDSEQRRRRHAFGATMTYQRLIGDFSGASLPSNLLGIGVTYKFS